jgi:hypothetical protein
MTFSCDDHAYSRGPCFSYTSYMTLKHIKLIDVPLIPFKMNVFATCLMFECNLGE